MSPFTSCAHRYDITVNPPYQINYRAKRAGKHVTATKRRITFQFGFSDARAIAAGHSEADCRGEEHEVVLVWSHVSGKRHLYMDGREIHMSKAARVNTRFEYSWGISGGHIMKIIANGTPPMGEKVHYARQFDLELDGMSFFEFSKIYELGDKRSRNATRSKTLPTITHSYRGLAHVCHDDLEEEEVPPPMPEVKSIDLLDLQGSIDRFESQPELLSPVSPSGSTPSLVGSSSSFASGASYDEFTPVEYKNEKTFDSISKDILCAYNSNSAPPGFVDSAPSTCLALVPASKENMDAITKSMRKLVNLDDITTRPAQPLAKPAAESPKGQHAVPSWALVGRAPTLAEIRDSQTVKSPGLASQATRLHSQHQHQHQQYPTSRYLYSASSQVAYHSATPPPSCYQARVPGMGYTTAY